MWLQEEMLGYTRRYKDPTACEPPHSCRHTYPRTSLYPKSRRIQGLTAGYAVSRGMYPSHHDGKPLLSHISPLANKPTFRITLVKHRLEFISRIAKKAPQMSVSMEAMEH